MTSQPHRIARIDETEYSAAELIKFHGHLGPYIVLGYRMGRFARKEFNNSPFLQAEVHCRDTPPESCLADGIQLGSGCSYGRRKISIIPSRKISCRFCDNRRILTLQPKKISLPPTDSPAYWTMIEKIATRWYSEPDGILFRIKQS